MKSKNSLGRLALLFAMLVLGAPGVGAQGTGGRISGTVLDSSGAVLPGATVTIVQEQTKLTKSTTTDKDGAYLFVSLPVGTYTVSAELSGFRKQVKSGYTLVSDGRVTADFALPVGQVSEVVEV
ncbi:MAG: TonB-dependent receptor, partial [Acidobacteria bacterium]